MNAENGIVHTRLRHLTGWMLLSAGVVAGGMVASAKIKTAQHGDEPALARTAVHPPAEAASLPSKSSAYFHAPLLAAGCQPLITTSGFMAPEAYTLDAIVRSWAAGDPPAAVKREAGIAYAQYQGISPGAGIRLFVTHEKSLQHPKHSTQDRRSKIEDRR